MSLDHVHDDFLDVVGFQNFAALLVDDFALLVHDVVVLENDFAQVEVVAFDAFLRRFDRTRDHFALDRLVFFEAETLHHVQHVVRAETFHQLVAQRQVELRGARVALASCASAKLVINPAGFMPLRTDDVQTAQLGHALAQQNVRTAARHVRGDRNGARLLSARDDFGFFGMVFGVQHLVFDAFALQHIRNELGVLDGHRADQSQAGSFCGVPRFPPRRP